MSLVRCRFRLRTLFAVFAIVDVEVPPITKFGADRAGRQITRDDASEELAC